MTEERLYPRTGFEPIDGEHRALSGDLEEFVNVVNSGRVEGVRRGLDAIIVGVASHFGHEEALMRDFKYPDLRRHQVAHDTFVADARRFQVELRAHGLNANVRRWAVGRLVRWFHLHILTHDIGLGLFLVKVGAGKVPGPGVEPGPPGAARRVGVIVL